MFDMIIIDTPPLLPVTDGAVAATRADGVLIVVRYGKTTRSQINASVHSLEAVDARILGCIVTMMPKKGADAAGYDGYGYYEENVKKGPPADLPRVISATARAAAVPVDPIAGQPDQPDLVDESLVVEILPSADDPTHRSRR
jgi:succinoglycan biosynthesis transport protein ExoP